jgi:hypothetical protein
MQIYEHMVKGLVCEGYRMEWITYRHVHICGVPTYLKFLNVKDSQWKLWVHPINAITRVVMNDFFFFTKNCHLATQKNWATKAPIPPKPVLLHSLPRLVKERPHQSLIHPANKTTINMIWLLLAIFDWPIIMIWRGGGWFATISSRPPPPPHAPNTTLEWSPSFRLMMRGGWKTSE